MDAIFNPNKQNSSTDNQVVVSTRVLRDRKNIFVEDMLEHQMVEWVLEITKPIWHAFLFKKILLNNHICSGYIQRNEIFCRVGFDLIVDIEIEMTGSINDLKTPKKYLNHFPVMSLSKVKI